MRRRKKLSCAKLRQKSLTCIVCVDVRAVTCPGVVLSKKGDVYLSVRTLGQCKTTPCLPPFFPLLFRHKLIFEKTFPGVVDPADVADLLEADTTSFELIQSVPPEGEILATMRESSRDFLYPAPRLRSRDASAGRDVPMTWTSPYFGISPRVECSVTSVIEESDGGDAATSSPAISHHPPGRSRVTATNPRWSPSGQPSFRFRDGPSKAGRGATEMRNLSPSLPRSGHVPKKDGKHKMAPRSMERGYLQPTVSSRARALNPYTHRKMCQLSEDAQQRLSHLQLGPHIFRKETESRVPFLVSRCGSGTETLWYPPQNDSVYRCPLSPSSDHTDSLLGSHGARTATVDSPEGSVFNREPRTKSPLKGTASKPKPRGQLNLRERLPTPSYSEQIHNRVQRILRTHRASWNRTDDFDL